jgi:serine/threonine-protein kinase
MNKFSPGTVLIDRYEILKFHAAGGMQEVYLCHDRTLNRHVALKTPKSGVKDRRFRRGAEMGARVVHANVAATFDYYEDQHYTFMIEEFITGTDLGQRLSNEFIFLDPALAAHVVRHIARAIHEAHRVGICHRDLKPSNIMTSNDPSLNSIKLTDFGIAKLAEAEIGAEMDLFDKDESTLTSSNTLLGAVPYMAPECWDNWKDAGQPMDVWSLGCIAYQLLAGELPFGYGRIAIRNVAMLAHSGITLNLPYFFGKHKATESLETNLWTIINNCIQVDPSKRPTAQEIVHACEDLLYAVATRRTGKIQRFKVPYQTGGTGSFGFIDDDNTAENFFFHESSYFGTNTITAGRRVLFSVYPGHPNSRAYPVLELRDSIP